MNDGPPIRPSGNGLLRLLLLVLGGGLFVLGAVGAFLPVLPTTPFLLLAAACFARSSPSFHRRLLASRIFGPTLTRWERDRTVPRSAKRKAYGLVVVTFAISIAVVDETWHRGMLAALGLGLLGFLWWLPTSPEEEQRDVRGEEPPRDDSA